MPRSEQGIRPTGSDMADTVENTTDAAQKTGSDEKPPKAKREFNKLLAWDTKDRAKALEKAIAGGWKQLYVPEDLRPTQGQYSAPETPHPASKVFKASDLDWPEVTNPVLQDLI